MKSSRTLLSRIWILCIMAVAIAACSTQQEDGKKNSDEKNCQNDELLKLLALSDAQSTPEQIALKKKVERLIVYQVVANGDSMKLTVESDYFIENSIPVEYYDQIVEACKSTNEFMKKTLKEAKERHAIVDFDLAASLEQNKRDYEQYLADVGTDSISYTEYRNRIAEKSYQDFVMSESE